MILQISIVLFYSNRFSCMFYMSIIYLTTSLIYSLSLFHHFLHISPSLPPVSPFSLSQLLLPQNASVFSAVKVKTSSSPHPPPPVPPCLSPDDCDSGLPLTSQTSSLASQSQPTENSKLLLILFNHTHHHHLHCHLRIRLFNNTHHCDSHYYYTKIHITYASTS